MKFSHLICPLALSFSCVAPFAGAMIASVDGVAKHNTTSTDYVSEIWNRTVYLSGGSSPGTGTYLGKDADGTHWIMTAAHVNPVAGGVSIGTEISLNYTGQHRYFYDENGTQADLELFSVSATGDAADYLNALGNIEIFTGTLYTNTPLYCVGTGANLSLGSGISSGGRVKQWGEFCADSTGLSDANGYSTYVFGETFSVEGKSIQCGMYDSGSGVFVKNGNDWEAVGVAIAVGADATNASKIGYQDDTSDSRVENPVCHTQFTYLSYYAKQIYAIIPEPSVFGLFAGIFALGFAGTRRRK